MSLDALLAPGAQVEKLVSGFKFTEGPVFSRRGLLRFTDIPNERIHQWERGKLSVYREKSNRANGLTYDHQGRLLVCEMGGRVTRTEKNGSITVLAAEGLKAPNDLVYSIDGSIYFTDPPRSRVYQITRKGQVRVVAEDCVAPNGVALGPNQQKLYVADIKSRKIRVYDVAGDGALSNARDFCQARGDGLKTDEGGNVWIASEGGLWVFDAAGQKLGVLATSEEPSNLCWGEGFRGLFITARTSVYSVATRVSGTRTY
jgi:gluconolactonase